MRKVQQDLFSRTKRPRTSSYSPRGRVCRSSFKKHSKILGFGVTLGCGHFSNGIGSPGTSFGVLLSNQEIIAVLIDNPSRRCGLPARTVMIP